MKTAKFLVISTLMFATSMLAITETVMPTIQRVLDTERLENADILLLKNGDKLTGTVLNENFSIRTSYAHIVVESKYIAGINLEGGANNIESIITVNNNRFSGLIDDAFISFKLTSGLQLEIGREHLLKIIFRQRPQETAGMKWRQFIQLKDGDYFHGQILTKDKTISTTYAKIPLDFETIESITLAGDANQLTIVKMTNGDTVQGTLEMENIEIELDVGSVIEVHQDRIDRIFFKEGYVPDSISFIVTSIEAVKGNLVLVEKGSFTIGDTWGDGFIDEKPTREITLTYNFYIGKYEVTFDEYDAFCEATSRSKPDDEDWGRGSRPVINVSWNDAIAYCNWLSETEGLPKAYDSRGNLLDKDGSITTDPSKVVGYRLPTEAEWEYAARGGNKSKGYKYSGSDNANDVAWYDSYSGSSTQEVGKKAPNELGIHDMSGNVWEWCSDRRDGRYYIKSPATNPYNYMPSTSRVFRGGGWKSREPNVRVANRDGGGPSQTDYFLGFRIAKTAP